MTQMRLEFFNTEQQDGDLSLISGIKYIPDFINQQEHLALLSLIDTSSWLLDLKRRVQHYGYKYDYQKRAINSSMKVCALPDWALRLGKRMYDEKIIDFIPDQLIVNEYEPGQGIAPHIDCEPCFESVIVSVSLGSSCVMDFYAKEDQMAKKSILLSPRSLIVLTGESRYQWLHGIANRKSDKYKGEIVKRTRRVSLTFRKVILQS